MLRINTDYKRPSPAHICWYIEYLAQEGRKAPTIKNHISHLRTFFMLAGLDLSALHSYIVTNALRALSITLRHIPNLKRGANPTTLRAALGYCGDLAYPEHVAFAILAMFHGFFRQSNMVPQRARGFDPTRHFTRDDFVYTNEGLSVTLKWSKTLQSSGCPPKVLLAPCQDSGLCPVSAYSNLLRVAPTTGILQPLLQFNDGNSLTIRYLADRWRELLMAAGMDPTKISLHSLRRGGATFAHTHGAKLPDIMAQGTWASDAVLAYIRQEPGQQSSVHRALNDA